MKKQAGQKKFRFRGRWFLPAVVLLYVVLFAVGSPAALPALHRSGLVLLKILPIIAAVICFTAVIN
jgi:hypothetical protein